MKESISGKKLLILGGAFQHCKVVEAAKRMGVITYVTDYLDVKLAPAKQIADKWFMYDINDIDAITNLCITEEIDGAIALSLDACQRPYQKICEKLGYPCFGTEEQYYILTDKNAFKKCCTENGVDTIPKYSLEDVLDEDICNSKVTFPIIIKPADSRGSRGQTVCDSWSTIKDAIEFAQKESNSKDVVIEKYMGNENDFSMTYIMIEGDAYLLRTDDRHLGSAKDRLDRLAIVGISPSRYAKLYSENVEQRVVNMLKNLGLKNAPVFMQGFVEGDTVRFYDPGLRFPGGEYERMYEAVYGINIVEALIYFSLLGYKVKQSASCHTRSNGKRCLWTNLEKRPILVCVTTVSIGKVERVKV